MSEGHYSVIETSVYYCRRRCRRRFFVVVVVMASVLLLNSYLDGKSECCYYSLTWTFSFPRARDTVYFAHCYPYSYSDLQVTCQYQHQCLTNFR